MAKITPEQATNILRLCGISRDSDFHALASVHVDCLILAADQLRYRKPRNANGSRGRYFHAYLCRLARRVGLGRSTAGFTAGGGNPYPP